MHDGKVFATSIEASTDNSSEAHLYNKNKDLFLKVEETSTNSVSKLGGFITEVRDNGVRYINMRPFEPRDSDSGSPFNGESGSAVFSNDERAIDGDSTSFATTSFSISGASGAIVHRYMYLNMPQLDFGSIIDHSSSMKVYVSYKIENFTNSGNVKFRVKYEGDSPSVNDNTDAILISTHTANTDVTAAKSAKVYIKNTSTATDKYGLIGIGDSGGTPIYIGRLYGGDWMLIPWDANSGEDITLTMSDATETIIEYMVFFE